MNRICLFLCFAYLSVLSCARILPSDINLDENFYDVVLHAQIKGTTVDAVNTSKDYCTIRLSDNNHFSASLDSVLLFSLSLTGGWTVRMDNSVTVVNSEAILDEMIPMFSSSCKTGSMVSILEDYSSWTFYFRGHNPVKLIKTLFSYDADSILKGVSHRGFSSEAPENTLEAYRLSKLRGFKYVETDVRFTYDGIPVLLHDKTIDRTSNGHGEIKNLTLEEVRDLDFGGWKSSSFSGAKIPTLEEFLTLCVEIGLEPNIELKAGSKTQIKKVVEMVESFGFSGNVTFISFSTDLLKVVLSCLPSANIGILANTVNEKVIDKALAMSTENNHVHIGASDYGETAVSLCRNANIPLSVWVIDSKDIILSLSSYISSVSSNSLHAGRVIYEAGK